MKIRHLLPFRKDDESHYNDDISILQHEVLDTAFATKTDKNPPIAINSKEFEEDDKDENVEPASQCALKNASEDIMLPPTVTLNLPDDVKPELAMAWFAKRSQHLREDGERKQREEERKQRQKEEQRRRQRHVKQNRRHTFANRKSKSESAIDVDSGLAVLQPIDVGTVMEYITDVCMMNHESTDDWHQCIDDDFQMTSSTSRVNQMIHPTWRVSEQQHNETIIVDDDSATHTSGFSGISKAQSEKTQITSNRPAGHVRTPSTSSLHAHLHHHPSPSTSLDNKFFALPYNNTKSATSSSSDGGERQVDDTSDHPDFYSTLKNEPHDIERNAASQCDDQPSDVAPENTNQPRRFFRKLSLVDFRRRRGKFWWCMVSLVALIFVITLISAVTLSRQRKRQSSDKVGVLDQGNNNVVTPAPIYVTAPTTSPTLLQTLFPTELDFNRHNNVNDINDRDTPAAFSLNTTSSQNLQPFPAVSFTSVENLVGEETRRAFFGSCVALSQSGNVLAVGAPNAVVNGIQRAGRVEVFERREDTIDSSRWFQRGPANLFRGRNPDGALGSSVALNSDGSVLAISTPSYYNATSTNTDRYGTVQVYRYDADEEEYSLLGSVLSGETAASAFGTAIQLSASGRYLIVGAPLHSKGGTLQQGTIYVYEYDSEMGDWKQLAWPLSGTSDNDLMGTAVAIYEDSVQGSFTIAASAPSNESVGGYVRVWKYRFGNWTKIGSDLTNQGLLTSKGHAARFTDHFGKSVSLTKRTVYVRNQNKRGNWHSRLYIAIGIPGKENIATGLENTGMTVVYQLNTLTAAVNSSSIKSSWEPVGQPIVFLNAAGDKAGQVVQFLQPINEQQELVVAVGAPGAKQSSGNVRLYRYDTATEWAEVEGSESLFTGNKPGEDFGSSLAIVQAANASSMMMAVGAPMEANSTTASADKNNDNNGGYVAFFTIR